MVNAIAVLGVDVEFLRVVVARLELTDVFVTVNLVAWALCDASDASVVLLPLVTYLHKRVPTSNGTDDWCWGIHCKISAIITINNSNNNNLKSLVSFEILKYS